MPDHARRRRRDALAARSLHRRRHTRPAGSRDARPARRAPCKHCNGETRFVRFHANSRKPRLWFHCLLEPTSACQKDQSISCSTDWRLLRPLWETDEIFQNLLASHSRYERAHHHARQRFRDSGKDVLSRPKRIGRSWQQLRSDASLVVEWFRICWRHGWLPGSKNRNHHEERHFRWKGREGAAKLAAERAAAFLHLPYGKKAAALGLGEELPPSRRKPPANGPGGRAPASTP